MRALACVFICVAGLICGSAPAPAADGPVIVIPGKRGVPVIINGFDASYTIVEGDWGLDRPGHMPPSIIAGPLVVPAQSDHRSWTSQSDPIRATLDPPVNPPPVIVAPQI